MALGHWRAGDATERAERPRVAEAHGLEADLQPGDAAYIPPDWWRHTSTRADGGGALCVELPFDLTAAEHAALPRPWTYADWGADDASPGGGAGDAAWHDREVDEAVRALLCVRE